jgi:ankyrin repeat protein
MKKLVFIASIFVALWNAQASLLPSKIPTHNGHPFSYFEKEAKTKAFYNQQKALKRGCKQPLLPPTQITTVFSPDPDQDSRPRKIREKWKIPKDEPLQPLAVALKLQQSLMPRGRFYFEQLRNQLDPSKNPFFFTNGHTHDSIAECVEQLKRENGLEQMDEQGRTILHFAARSSSHITRLLIAAGANVHSKTLQGRSALHAAIIHMDNRDAVQSLLEAGVLINDYKLKTTILLHLIETLYQATVARYSAPYALLTTAQVLLTAGAKPLQENTYGTSLLLNALKKSYAWQSSWPAWLSIGPDTIRTLVDLGANLFATDSDGTPLLELAQHYKHDPATIQAISDEQAALRPWTPLALFEDYDNNPNEVFE